MNQVAFVSGRAGAAVGSQGFEGHLVVGARGGESEELVQVQPGRGPTERAALQALQHRLDQWAGPPVVFSRHQVLSAPPQSGPDDGPVLQQAGEVFGPAALIREART